MYSFSTHTHRHSYACTHAFILETNKTASPSVSYKTSTGLIPPFSGLTLTLSGASETLIYIVPLKNDAGATLRPLVCVEIQAKRQTRSFDFF